MSAIEHEITDDEYEELLDEIYPEVDVCGYKYSAGRLLKEIDPIAFRCGKSDMMQWECSECGKVYDEEDDAKDCWQDCADTFECEECSEKLLRSDDKYEEWSETYYDNHGDVIEILHFCSEKCRDKYTYTMNSHLGDEE